MRHILNDCSFEGVDIALFSAGGSISKKLGPVAAAAGCVVRAPSMTAPPCQFSAPAPAPCAHGRREAQRH